MWPFNKKKDPLAERFPINLDDIPIDMRDHIAMSIATEIFEQGQGMSGMSIELDEKETIASLTQKLQKFPQEMKVLRVVESDYGSTIVFAYPDEEDENDSGSIKGSIE